jgi:acetyl esterase/lipase
MFVVARLGYAQETVWQPSQGHVQVPLWPSTIPDARHSAKAEHTVLTTEEKDFVAGKPWLSIENVSRPTLTVYQPKGRNTGVSVMVFPGGGFSILAIDLEGTEICDWLNSLGMTCVLLKYRVPNPRSAPYWGAYPGPRCPWKTLKERWDLFAFTRKNGKSIRGSWVSWGSRPEDIWLQQRVFTLTSESMHAYSADDESCRPDFAVAIYPGHLAFKRRTLKLNPDIAKNINSRTPPTFLLQNENDDVDSVWDALSYQAALIKAKVPVEFHSFAEGGHAFGLRPSKYPATRWPQLVEVWLHSIGMISE